MINIFYMDNDPLYYIDLSSWLPDFCTINQITVKSIDHFPVFNHITDILLINPEYFGNSTETLMPVLQKLHNIPVIFISETISLPFVVYMVKNGAYSFLHKKKDKSIIIECIKEILYKSPEKDETCNIDYSSIQGIIGNSIPVKNLKNEIISFKGHNLNVHLYGETGTGKELTAKALHNQSFQQEKSIVTINCGAIPDNLIESELFGTAKGAFTDAQNRSGLFEKANGTTIFLDEIGELSKTAQVKLLRVLEDGIFSRIGDSTERKSDFNLITATNKNLKTEVREGRFREDLYYRITSLMITLPTLRERKEDIYDLSLYFLNELGSSKKLSQSAVLKLIEYKWPGNIRELKQTIIRADYLSKEKKSIDPNHIIYY
jgi:transcriptional regulator with PAS, ATPase and Fis domain